MRWACYLGYVVMLGGLVGIGYGIWEIYSQSNLIATATPVQATVVDGRIKKIDRSNFIMWAPEIDYEYEIGAQKYSSSSVTPTEVAGSKGWAEQVIAQYPVGERVDARVDPHNPESAFLLPKHGPTPYLTVLVSTVIAAMGLGVVLEQAWAGTSPSQSQAAMSGVRLDAKRHHMILYRVFGLIGAAGVMVGGPTMLHFAMVSSPPRDPLFLLLAAAYGIAVAVMIGWFVLGYWRHGRFGTPCVMIDNSRPQPGDTVHLEVTVPIRFNGYLNTISLRLECESKDQSWFDISGQNHDQVFMRQEADLVQAMDVVNGDQIKGKGHFTLERSLPPSTAPTDKAKMHIIWTLHLNVKANRGRSLEAEYILDVASPS